MNYVITIIKSKIKAKVESRVRLNVIRFIIHVDTIILSVHTDATAAIWLFKQKLADPVPVNQARLRRGRNSNCPERNSIWWLMYRSFCDAFLGFRRQITKWYAFLIISPCPSIRQTVDCKDEYKTSVIC